MSIELTTEIVSAYVSNNSVHPDLLPQLIRGVYDALVSVGRPVKEPVAPLVPAVPIKRSITPDAIICLEDGRLFKSLKRHLQSKYDMTPGQYRAKWGLPSDYPMVAPNYAAQRSALAKTSGLGTRTRD